MRLKTRMQYCPVCQKQTPHTYQPVSWAAFIVLFVIFVIPAFIYLVVALRRADRTATCTVDHAALDRAKRDEDMRRLAQYMGHEEKPKPRGTGFMSDRY